MSDDSFFSMPQDSLITLSAQRPVWNKILSYLPMAAKKNLRLSHPRDLKDALLDDPTWIWSVNLGDQIQYPDYFYESTTPLRVNFPRRQNGRLKKNPDISDQMIGLIEKIKPRIVGLAVKQATLNQYTDHVRINSLQFIEIDGEYEVMSEIAMQLLTSNCDSFQEITLRFMDMDNNIRHMLNSVTFLNVKKLQLIEMRFDIRYLLRACSNVQQLLISGGYSSIKDEDGFMLTSVKKMDLEYSNDKNASILLRMVPNVEELTITGDYIDIPNKDFSLIHLTKLSLKEVVMSTSTMNILKAKLPEALKLEDCMDEKCKIFP